MITETQKDRMTDAFMAMFDAAKEVVAPGAVSAATASRLLKELADAVHEVEVTCAAIELENSGLVEERPTP